jgi:hypothetical protein
VVLALLRNFWRLQFVVLLSVPAILLSGLNLRQSNSASVATWLYKRYVISSPFSSFVVVPGGDHALLVAQSDHRIDTHRTARGDD